ncbi:hypothetical protein [Streptomyces sp. MP131-18]|uniref:hypothetical protein n=1 Tax=Streptomyces sp. MP131-18 TaxID=1857892 RepID=UPI00097C88A7|nr:hypothetical protein [Streptomyces sp. MP131-18]ONK10401.1 hypothetical protein STBA_11230 [Streptomyces sp. MP131-18]
MAEVINMAAIQAMNRGLIPGQSIRVELVSPAGVELVGSLVGAGSKLAIQSWGALVEDLPIGWVRSVVVVD